MVRTSRLRKRSPPSGGRAGLQFFLARDSTYEEGAICCCPSFFPSVRPSVTQVDQSKTAELRTMQISPLSSPIPLVFVG